MVYLEQGYSQLLMSDLSSIEIDDILIISSSSVATREHSCIRFPSGEKYIAKKTANNNRIYKLLEKLPMHVNEIEKDINLKDLSITVTFDLGKKMITLGELEKVGVGYSLELDKTLKQLVTIRVDNQVLGQGEIIEVGDRLGVRVTELNESKKSQHNG
jgi:flagellar motor switch/type III secretory pathway protein FliN